MMAARPMQVALACVVATCAGGTAGGRIALAQEADRPPAVLSTCLPCHGRDGIGTTPLTPNLAGQKSLYLVKQLKAFKSGERRNEQMSLIAESLADDAIKNAAEWYASRPAGGGGS